MGEELQGRDQICCGVQDLPDAAPLLHALAVGQAGLESHLLDELEEGRGEKVRICTTGSCINAIYAKL